MMVNLPVSLIAMALLLLAYLPSSAAFSATLKAQGNETKIFHPSASHDSEAEAPAEVESWTEALSSPKDQEPGNSFILHVQMQGHGQMQMHLVQMQNAQMQQLTCIMISSLIQD